MKSFARFCLWFVKLFLMSLKVCKIVGRLKNQWFARIGIMWSVATEGNDFVIGIEKI
jgi:hypothetical protein